MSRRLAIAFGLSLAASGPAFAQSSALTDQQSRGRELFYQHCGVCHTKPNLAANSFGPTLSKALFANGNDAQIREIIANGAPDMPGFSVEFKPAQIDAIISYLKQMPAPAPRNK